METFEHTYDPLTNIVTQRGFVDDKMVTRTESDCAANLDYATQLRNSDEYSSEGIKKGFFHAAHIPAIVVVELLQNGVDIYRSNAKEIVAGLKKINKEHLLTTRKRI
jgi:hypothetical protein